MHENSCEEKRCVGCMACAEICPKGAVSIRDELKAYNSIINEKLCIDCGLCYNICQVNHPIKLKQPIMWKQGWTRDETVRLNSSSGGIATELEKKIVTKGGVVCSCTFEKGHFIYKIVDDEQQITKFSGSKYVKSNPYGIYKAIKDLLGERRMVLFVGLPCHAAALKKFVGTRLEENLYLIDLICHGTPSPQILNLFLLQHRLNLHEIKSIRFRNNNQFQVYVDEKPVTYKNNYDSYSISFLNTISFTENCYDCNYAKLERCTDITLGDSWGSELPDEERKRGISLIICQTEKGKRLLEKTNIHFETVSKDKAVKYNGQLQKPSDKPDNRDAFFRELEKNTLDSIAWKFYKGICAKQVVKQILIRLKIIHV